jgi:hypothetical protein
LREGGRWEGGTVYTHTNTHTHTHTHTHTTPVHVFMHGLRGGGMGDRYVVRRGELEGEGEVHGCPCTYIIHIFYTYIIHMYYTYIYHPMCMLYIHPCMYILCMTPTWVRRGELEWGGRRAGGQESS